MNLTLNDPALPAPGEFSTSGGSGGEQQQPLRTGSGHSYLTASPSSIGGTRTVANGDPHHQRQRAPSLGEMHQVLEIEQEGQVNRMLQLIREQRLQLEHMQRLQQESLAALRQSQTQSQPASTWSTTTTDDPQNVTLTPASERSFALLPTTTSGTSPRHSLSHSRSRTLRDRDRDRERPVVSRSPVSFSRQTPRMPSPSTTTTTMTMTETHALTAPIPIPTPTSPAGDVQFRRRSSNSSWHERDESAFYQAETANLTRENQMLRHRIRELERQLAEANTIATGSIGAAGSGGGNARTSSPHTPSRLSLSTSASASAGAGEKS